MQMEAAHALTDLQVRAIMRRFHVPAFWAERKDLKFRDQQILKFFGEAMELAYYDQTAWAILYPSALMLISRYNLAAHVGAAVQQQPPTTNTNANTNANGT